MVVNVLNASPSEAYAQVLLSHHLTAFADVDIIAAQKHYPAHRAVLAVHSLDFRDAFATPTIPPAEPSAPIHVSPTPAPLFPATTPPTPLRVPDPQPISRGSKVLPRYRVHIALEDVDDSTLLRGWALVYAYIYGATVHLETEAVLAALPICRRYRFDQLAAVLDAFLCEGAVSPANCTRVYAAAGVRGLATGKTRRKDSDAELVQTAAWAVLKGEFAAVSDWGVLPYAALVRLLKLNDLQVPSETAVFDAVVDWVNTNRSNVDDDVVAGLVKLVRFPTMSMEQLEKCAASDLVRSFPVCRKYVSRGIAARADEQRGLVRNVVMESSPVYRRRRMDALTFSDRVPNWSRVDKSVHTSSRYFAGCLWNLIVEVPQSITGRRDTRGHGHGRGGQGLAHGQGQEDVRWIGLFLGCLSETEEREVDVELDFSVFIVRHTGAAAEPELIRKEVKGACFSRSGQRTGFSKLIRRFDIDADGRRFLLRDTLFIGASIRLRSSKLPVIGITPDGDDTAEAESTMI